MQVKCPYCNHDGNTIGVCHACGEDLLWVERLYIKSEYYYNKAYEYANSRALSLAIPCLEKAISFNKYNVKAKNLLGLIYFEIGEVASALKLWILSDALCKEDNIAVEYMNRLQKMPKKLEGYKDSLTLYNRALRYLEKKDDDMAVIRLKKAINLNPNFLEARNLLALCYIYQKQEHKALAQLRYVLKKDTVNKKALYYLGQLESDKFILEEPQQNIISAPHINDLDISTEVKPQKVIQRGGLFTRYAMYFIFGAICMFGVETALILPSKTAVLEKKVYDVTAENASLKVEFDTFIEESKVKQTSLDTTNKKLTEEKNSLQQMYNVTAQENKLWEAQSLKEEGEWKAAAEILNNISTKDLKPEYQTIYEELKENVYSKASEAFYREGNQLYDEGNYVDATLAFEKCVIFAPGTRRAAGSIYNMAQIEEKNNNNSKALQLYKIIIEEYKDSSYYNRAKDGVEKLGKNNG